MYGSKKAAKTIAKTHMYSKRCTCSFNSTILRRDSSISIDRALRVYMYSTKDKNRSQRVEVARQQKEARKRQRQWATSNLQPKCKQNELQKSQPSSARGTGRHDVQDIRRHGARPTKRHGRSSSHAHRDRKTQHLLVGRHSRHDSAKSRRKTNTLYTKFLVHIKNNNNVSCSFSIRPAS